MNEIPIPRDIIKYIFLLCSLHDLFYTLPRVCKVWEEIIHRDTPFWKYICTHYLNIQSDNHTGDNDWINSSFREKAVNRYKALLIFRDILESKHICAQLLCKCLPFKCARRNFDRIRMRLTPKFDQNVYLRSICPHASQIFTRTQELTGTFPDWQSVVISAKEELDIQFPTKDCLLDSSTILEIITKTLTQYPFLVVHIHKKNDFERGRGDGWKRGHGRSITKL